MQDALDRQKARAQQIKLENKIERLWSALSALVDGLELAEKNGDLPLPFVGYGHVFIERAKEALSHD